MPVFFFQIREGQDFIPDLEGVDLPGAKAALTEARAAAREILAKRVRQGELIDRQGFEVCDELGTKIFTLPFKSVLRLD